MSAKVVMKIPDLLLPVLEKARERLAAHDGWARIEGLDQKVAGNLDRVLVCSEYAADVMARYPQAFAELVESGRIHKVLEGNELEIEFLAGAQDNETENQFMRRLRIFRHREMIRIVFRDCQQGCCHPMPGRKDRKKTSDLVLQVFAGRGRISERRCAGRKRRRSVAINKSIFRSELIHGE